jgi:hypothetical protein
MLVEMLAYVARSERLKISPKAARARHRLPSRGRMSAKP